MSKKTMEIPCSIKTIGTLILSYSHPNIFWGLTLLQKPSHSCLGQGLKKYIYMSFPTRKMKMNRTRDWRRDAWSMAIIIIFMIAQVVTHCFIIQPLQRLNDGALIAPSAHTNSTETKAGRKIERKKLDHCGGEWVAIKVLKTSPRHLGPPNIFTRQKDGWTPVD